MSQMTSFVNYLLSSLPDFLLSEPIIYFVGIYFLLCVVGVIRRIIHL